MSSDRTAGGWARRPRPPKPRPLSGVLGELLEPVSARARTTMQRIRLNWGSICGQPLARHLEPLDIEPPFLRIGVRDRQWREAVFHERHVLTRRLRRIAPGLRGIRLVSLPPGAPQPEQPAAQTPSDPRTEGITDAGLRAAFDALLHSRGRPADD